MSKTIRCQRCRKRCRNLRGWNVTHIAGLETGHLCPACQTAEEDLEAQVNEVLAHPSTWEFYWPETGDEFVDRMVPALVKTYRTPAKLREKADELEAARTDQQARVMVGLMRALADDMESGAEEE